MLIHQLLGRSFTNCNCAPSSRPLRHTPEDITAAKMTYDLTSPCADLGPWLALAFTATLHRTHARELG